MEFTVFTTSGGLRVFAADSTYTVGEHNGVLYVWDGSTGQVVTYGPSAWASVQETQRGDKPESGRRKLLPDQAPS